MYKGKLKTFGFLLSEVMFMAIEYTITDSHAVINVPYSGNKSEQGIYEVLVDLDDLQRVIELNRSLTISIGSNRKPYVMYKHKNVMKYLHTFILGSKEGMDVDHKDGRTLDNRRANLRHIPRHLNSRNTDKHRVSKHGYKWVAKNRNKWAANIRHKKEKVYVGNYDTPLEAHRAANRWVYVNIGSEFCTRQAIKIPQPS